MIFRVADNLHTSAVFSHAFTLGNCIRGVVGAFRVKVGLNGVDQLVDRWLVEDGDRIHEPERCQDLCPFAFRDERPPVSFQQPNLLVRIQRNNQKASEVLRACEIAHMTGMDQIETTVRQYDLYSGGALGSCSGDKVLAGKDRGGVWIHQIRVARLRSSGCASREARTSASVATAVPRFMTTIPPA